ncbi:MAG: hypothetical protein IJW13_03655 [Clostridia bacterium]|nr:hypothetical protein [Clostridia bacterium]
MNALVNLLVEVSIDFGRFASSFKYMGIGMLGIFIVITVLVLGIVALNKLTAPRNKKDDSDNE